jgi:hypothetical protein
VGGLFRLKGACPGLWILVAADEQNDLPVLDDREVPLMSSGQRMCVPLSQIENTPPSSELRSVEGLLISTHPRHRVLENLHLTYF